MVKSGTDRVDACKKGVIAALSRKAKPGAPSSARLLIYTRAYTLQVIDEGYANVVTEAVREFVADHGREAIPFATIYFVDEREFAEL